MQELKIENIHSYVKLFTMYDLLQIIKTQLLNNYIFIMDSDRITCKSNFEKSQGFKMKINAKIRFVAVCMHDCIFKNILFTRIHKDKNKDFISK